MDFKILISTCPNCWQKMVQYASRKFLPFGPTHLVFWQCIWHSMHQSLITALWMLHSYCMLCNCAWTFASFDLFSSGCTTIAHAHYCAREYTIITGIVQPPKLSNSNKASLKFWNLGWAITTNANIWDFMQFLQCFY